MSRPPRFAPIAWGVYLATSWTWCIGMILPALLLRDHGWAGFMLFALPNIVGAAAMGWVFASRNQSKQYARSNAAAIAGFSLITIAFHGAAIPWAISLLGAAAMTPALLAAALVSIAIALSGPNRTHLVTIGCWALSIATLGTLLRTDVGTASAASFPLITGTADMIMLAPVVIFGFLLSPYLDATFHRAAQSVDAPGRKLAFTVGFGVFFALMILTSTLYARPLLSLIGGADPGLSSTILTWLGIHLGAQAGLTISLHAREGRPETLCRYRWSAAALIALLAGSAIWVLADAISLEYRSIFSGEIIYRVFLGAYGLLAPLYILLRKLSPPTGPIWARWTLLCVLTAPAFGYGFLARDGLGLLVGIGILLIGLPWSQIRRSRAGTTARSM